ncbi:hypothetical protein AX16_003706 [Volvariella volvacea WC 439]|nr:hypothetical protein AX16_003706 [Volvariella volvacea WC 439]
MCPYKAGTRVFFWGATAQTIYGTVQSTSRLPDGTQILVIQEDGGRVVSLPAASVTKAT